MNLIFDLDGTLVFQGKPVSPSISDALHDLRLDGHTIGFASARPHRDMLPVLDERFHDALLIGANGAMTCEGGVPVRLNCLPPETYDSLRDLAARYRAAYLVDLVWDYHVSGDTSHPFFSLIDPGCLGRHVEHHEVENPVKFLVAHCDDPAGFRREVQSLSVAVHQHSDMQLFDMTCHGVDKMSALADYGVGAGQFVCFGNDFNDMPMFRHAAHSVQIGEHPGLAELASERLPSGPGFDTRLIETLRRLAT
ncbi:HAD family hydrolase [Paludibacterium paludis]|uniref:Hydrolase n=1 Tax=Paludibacterium paludis TaxID=1225769 RepID=A0A918UBP0_9NEIS|nr:HAD family hydrolase [Paludibacterium paludis]GGY26820.1 hydrolase [Paludibacterium paludis]